MSHYIFIWLVVWFIVVTVLFADNHTDFQLNHLFAFMLNNQL